MPSTLSAQEFVDKWRGIELKERSASQAVLNAYGWPHEISDEEILELLLALNLERSGG